MADIITIGEAMVVFIAEEEGKFKDISLFSKGLAGAELNVSVGLTRLGYDAKYVTRLGSDPFGEYILEFIGDERIDASSIMIDQDNLTGYYLKSKVKQGDPKVFYYRKNSAASHLNTDDILNADFKNARLLHLSGITPALSASCRQTCLQAIEKARENNMLVAFDPNIRRALWTSDIQMREVLNDIASRCDIVFPGIKEGEILTGKNSPEKIADYYMKLGVKKVIVKLGPKGAYFQTTEENGYVDSFFVDKIVDTVGAGDAFATGCISGILDGVPIKEAVIRGNAMGAIIITSKKDNDILPTREELFAYIEGRVSRNGKVVKEW